MRRATLVPGFRVSWAGEGDAGTPEAPRRPGGQGCERGRCPPAGSRSIGRETPARADPRTRLPAGLTDFRWPSGDCRSRATRLQPNVARVATALLQSTGHQYSNLRVKVVLRGATGESPTEGSGLSRGGTPGGQGAANRCAGLTGPPDGVFSEGTDGRAGAPFAPLSCVCPSAPARLDVPSCALGSHPRAQSTESTARAGLLGAVMAVARR